jgi:hypothetical protein
VVRRVQRAFLDHLLTRGPSTIDAICAAVMLPAGTDPRLTDVAVRALAVDRLIVTVGRQRSTRPAAHGRMIAVWDLPCPGDALEWLADHPEFDPRRGSGRGAQKVNHPLLERGDK